jgi:preprotein translocase subunit YajC
MNQVLYTVAQAAPVPVTTPGVAPAGAPNSTTIAPPAKTAAAAQQPDMGSALSSLALPVLMIVIFYFLLIRPQQKREKERQKLLKGMEKGDRVLTRGGIFGTIVGVKPEENIAIVKIADDVKVEVAISTIETVLNKSASK